MENKTERNNNIGDGLFFQLTISMETKQSVCLCEWECIVCMCLEHAQIHTDSISTMIHLHIHHIIRIPFYEFMLLKQSGSECATVSNIMATLASFSGAYGLSDRRCGAFDTETV